MIDESVEKKKMLFSVSRLSRLSLPASPLRLSLSLSSSLRLESRCAQGLKIMAAKLIAKGVTMEQGFTMRGSLSPVLKVWARACSMFVLGL